MSESQATTSVLGSCASDGRGRMTAGPAAAAAAAPPVTFRNDRRSMRALIESLLAACGLVLDRLGPEKDVLGAIQIVLVELADQLLAGRRREILRVLVGVADLDPLDVAPARVGGAVDRPLDAVGAVADDARQGPGHAVVVLAEPPLVVLVPDARLQGRDDVTHAHRSPPYPRRVSPRPPARSSRPGRRRAECGRGPPPRRSRPPARCPARRRARRAAPRSSRRARPRAPSGPRLPAGSGGDCRA